jgi:hypothetical protein
VKTLCVGALWRELEVLGIISNTRCEDGVRYLFSQ